MTAAQAPSGDPYYRLPHPMPYPLAVGRFFIATCRCHFGQPIALNWRGRQK